MKSTFLKVFMAICLTVLITPVKAQVGDLVFPPGCLGVHCQISVNFNTDPVENDYLKYTIPAPREGISSIQGPAGCHLLNNLGNTVDIYVRKSHLELTLSDMPSAQVPFELFIPRWISPHGAISSDPSYGAQCYYYVIFNLTTLN